MIGWCRAGRKANRAADFLPWEGVYAKTCRRRLLAVALCFSPVAVLAASVIYGAACGTRLTWGLAPVLVAALLAALNLHLSVTRPLLYRRKHGSMAGYRFVSGVPLVGTALVTEPPGVGSDPGPHDGPADAQGT
jgi:hypothetical protein